MANLKLNVHITNVKVCVATVSGTNVESISGWFESVTKVEVSVANVKVNVANMKVRVALVKSIVDHKQM